MIHYITTIGIGQPWVGNELHIVDEAGVPLRLHAMRKPSGFHFKAEWAERLNAETQVIYPIPKVRAILDVLAAPFLFGGRFFGAAWNALFGERESLRQRLAALSHFFVACHWARSLRREDVSVVHSQWIHSCGTIGMYGAWLLNRPFSFTGHAVDLFRDRVALKDKVRRADFIICISEFHRDLYLELGARPEQLVINYCGIDVDFFVPKPERKPTRTILSSGRLVEKKGFDTLIEACGILRDRGVDVTCLIGGSGPLDAELRQLVADRNLSDRIEISGEAIDQEDLPEFMYGGELYVLACTWSNDRDVDGLPQMLMEAMACGLPVVSTRLVGIPDLVKHEESGLLVEPDQPVELADAIQRLVEDDEFAARLAAQGRETIIRDFNLETCMEPLLGQLRRKLDSSSS